MDIFRIAMPGLLVLILAVVPVYSRDYWECGDVTISRHAECHCGETTLTYSDEKHCGPAAQCSIDATGRGQCSAGTVCSCGTWLCGDIIIPDYSDCLCGGDRITGDNYYSGQQWCCLQDTEQCEHKDSGLSHHAALHMTTLVLCVETPVCILRTGVILHSQPPPAKHRAPSLAMTQYYARTIHSGATYPVIVLLRAVLNTMV